MKWVRRLLWGGLFVVAGLLFVRTFFLRVYYVDSPSMEPTLHGALEGGDHALVAFGNGKNLARGDIVVILPDGEGAPLVKRVGALPGEKVVLRNGDLWIDEEIVRSSETLAVPIPIFDDALHDFSKAFLLPDAWAQEDGAWSVDASDVEPTAFSACSYMRLSLRDHYLDPGGLRKRGIEEVGDALLRCQVRVQDPGFVVRLGLIEEGDIFELLIETMGLPRAIVSLLRNRRVVESGVVVWGLGYHELGFGNVNNRLTFEFDGKRVLTHDYELNQFQPNPILDSTMPESRGRRVYLGGHSGRAEFRGVRVLRDLHYSARGKYAVEEPLELGPDEIFLLGDNSRKSRDGREWGPTLISDVIGRPLGVVWPFDRLREL